MEKDESYRHDLKFFTNIIPGSSCLEYLELIRHPTLFHPTHPSWRQFHRRTGPGMTGCPKPKQPTRTNTGRGRTPLPINTVKQWIELQSSGVSGMKVVACNVGTIGMDERMWNQKTQFLDLRKLNLPGSSNSKLF